MKKISKNSAYGDQSPEVIEKFLCGHPKRNAAEKGKKGEI